MSNPLKVYVAGATVERHTRAIPVMAALREAGVVIMHDWTANMQTFSNAEHSDADVPEHYRKECAVLDMNGVRLADFVLLLAPDERGSSGSWVEFGLACGLGVPVIVAGARARRTIFTSLAYLLFATDGQAVMYLATRHRAHG
jgi:nucleoside 2-deoxyribosyltransferase